MVFLYLKILAKAGRMHCLLTLEPPIENRYRYNSLACKTGLVVRDYKQIKNWMEFRIVINSKALIITIGQQLIPKTKIDSNLRPLMSWLILSEAITLSVSHQPLFYPFSYIILYKFNITKILMNRIMVTQRYRIIWGMYLPLRQEFRQIFTFCKIDTIIIMICRLNQRVKKK